jgi:hypothetical protein
MRGLVALALAAELLAGCGNAIPVDPSAIPGSDLVLTFDGRGNPPVVLRINGEGVAHLPCLQGESRRFAPGGPGVPRLPWELEVVRERDGVVLLAERVTSMPKFILAFPEVVRIGVRPASGPPPPTCAPA